MRVSLIHNPGSGDDDHSGEQLVDLLTQAGHHVRYHRSKTDWHATLDDRPDLLAVAGGDGTVCRVAKAIAGRNIPITILPTGTANNIAGCLGLSEIPLQALVDGWRAGDLKLFDVGVARGPWGTHRFLESVGVGVLASLISEIDAGAAAYVNELSGRIARLDAALDVAERVLKRSTPVECDVELDDLRLHGEYLLIEILNFGAAGPNLRLAPDADGGDGMLDVALVEAHERSWLEQHLSDIRTDPGGVAPLRVHQARRVAVRCEPCALHLDDEMREHDGKRTWVEATVEHSALTFLVPAVAKEHGYRRMYEPARLPVRLWNPCR